MQADLRRASFEEADLRNARFLGADLRGASLESANLADVSLAYANIEGASFLGIATLDLDRIRSAQNWRLAFYSDIIRRALDLPEDHNKKILEELTKLGHPIGADPEDILR